MGDAWDDDEFDVQLPVVGDAPAAWDDEEEFEPEPVVAHGDAPRLSKEKEAKLEREKNAAREAALDAALGDEETDGERRLRERQEVEEADHELSNELFAGSAAAKTEKVQMVAGIEGYALKTLKDHLLLAHDVADAFEKKKSKANFQTKCVKEVRNERVATST